MNSPLSSIFFFAWRFLRSTPEKSTIHSTLIINTTSIFLSSFALVLGLSILNGLHTSTLQTLKGFTPDIIMHAPQGNNIDYEQCKQIIQKKHLNTIIASALYTITPVILISRYNQPIPGTLMTLSKDDFLRMYPQAIVTTKKKQPQTLTQKNNTKSGNSCIISRAYAQAQDITLYDTIDIATYEYTAHTQKASCSFENHTYWVEGIYEYPTDQEIMPTIISTSPYHDSLEQQNSEQSIGIRISEQKELKKVAAHLSKTLPELSIQTWHELFPELCAACSLETYGFIAIILLIIIISGTNLASLTTLFIANKRREIEILALNGMNNQAIRAIFYTINMAVTLFSTLLGTIVALGIAYIMNTYHLVHMPTTIYYTAFLPAYPSLGIIALPFILFISLALLISYSTLRSQTLSKEHI